MSEWVMLPTVPPWLPSEHDPPRARLDGAVLRLRGQAAGGEPGSPAAVLPPEMRPPESIDRTELHFYAGRVWGRRYMVDADSGEVTVWPDEDGGPYCPDG